MALMLDDDEELDYLVSRALKAEAEKADIEYSPLWPSIRQRLHPTSKLKRRRLRPLWLFPAIATILGLTGATALAVRSGTAPINWIIHPVSSAPAASRPIPQPPPPRVVSQGAAARLLGVPIVQLSWPGEASLKSIVYYPTIAGRRGAAVNLTYSAKGIEVIASESNGGPGSLDTKLKGNPSKPAANGDVVTAMEFDGGSYEMERTPAGRVVFVMWKTTSGTMVAITAGAAKTFSLMFVKSLIGHFR